MFFSWPNRPRVWLTFPLGRDRNRLFFVHPGIILSKFGMNVKQGSLKFVDTGENLGCYSMKWGILWKTCQVLTKIDMRGVGFAERIGCVLYLGVDGQFKNRVNPSLFPTFPPFGSFRAIKDNFSLGPTIFSLSHSHKIASFRPIVKFSKRTFILTPRSYWEKPFGLLLLAYFGLYLLMIVQCWDGGYSTSLLHSTVILLFIIIMLSPSQHSIIMGLALVLIPYPSLFFYYPLSGNDCQPPLKKHRSIPWQPLADWDNPLTSFDLSFSQFYPGTI